MVWGLLALNVAYIVFLILGKANAKAASRKKEIEEQQNKQISEPEPAPVEKPIVVRTIQPKPKEEEENAWWNDKIVLPNENRMTTRKKKHIDPDQQLLTDLDGNLFED